MKRFELHRDIDEGGVSGTGIVAEGIEFRKGKVAICWLTEVSSTTIYDSIADVEKIHGHAGKTRIMWIDQREHVGGYRDQAPPVGGTNSPKPRIGLKHVKTVPHQETDGVGDDDCA